jgi:DNA-binding response OmpR family regulator
MNKNESENISVLIVEDESIPAHYLQGIIEEDALFSVKQIVSNAKEALQVIEGIRPQIVFMDIMIEGAISGAELAVMIRLRHPEVLILFVTAYSDEEMVEYAADAEAFAYLLKPYRPREIHATLKLAKSWLRNKRWRAPASSVDMIDGFLCHTDGMYLTLEREIIPLSPKEAGLIRILCENIGRVIAKTVIMEQLGISDASLRALIYRIRKITSERLIRSVKRYGYLIVVKNN